MKVERINELQIKFVLTKTDLEKRSLDINDLAYGSSKTQELFQDIIETASREFSFNMEETPLMIEAVPISKNSITIMLTKVSKNQKLPNIAETLAKDIIEGRLQEERAKKQEQDEEKEDSKSPDKDMIRIPKFLTDDKGKKKETNKFAKSSKCVIYSFEDLNDISKISKMLPKMQLESCIYKYKNEYILIIENKKSTNEKVQNVNKILTEYGKRINGKGELLKAYFYENGEKIIAKKAIEIMAKI